MVQKSPQIQQYKMSGYLADWEVAELSSDLYTQYLYIPGLSTSRVHVAMFVFQGHLYH